LVKKGFEKMSDKECEVLFFEEIIPMMNLELNKKHEKIYDMHKVVLWSKWLTKGFYPEKFFKATRKGTKIRFRPVKDFDKEIKRMNDFISSLNEKYKTELPKL
jgi:hypothetical protein